MLFSLRSSDLDDSKKDSGEITESETVNDQRKKKKRKHKHKHKKDKSSDKLDVKSDKERKKHRKHKRSRKLKDSEINGDGAVINNIVTQFVAEKGINGKVKHSVLEIGETEDSDDDKLVDLDSDEVDCAIIEDDIDLEELMKQKERLQACLVQYLSDDSEKEEKNGEKSKNTELPDVILVEDSGDEAQPQRKKRNRSISDTRDHRKVMKTDRRVVVDMSRGDKKIRDELERRKESDRRREEKPRSRDEVKKDERPPRKLPERYKDDSRKDDSNRKKLEDDRSKEANRKEDLRRKDHDRRYNSYLKYR